jgi:hypothetical protein
MCWAHWRWPRGSQGGLQAQDNLAIAPQEAGFETYLQQVAARARAQGVFR